jgi:hypothetical protein
MSGQVSLSRTGAMSCGRVSSQAAASRARAAPELTESAISPCVCSCVCVCITCHDVMSQGAAVVLC